MPCPRSHHHVVMSDRLLIRQNVAADSRDRLEIAGSAWRWASASSPGATRTWAGSSVDPVDPPGIVERRLEPARRDVGADPLDNLPRLERLAKRRDRSRLARGTDHIPFGTQFARSAAIACLASSRAQSIRRIFSATAPTYPFKTMDKITISDRLPITTKAFRPQRLRLVGRPSKLRRKALLPRSASFRKMRQKRSCPGLVNSEVERYVRLMVDGRRTIDSRIVPRFIDPIGLSLSYWHRRVGVAQRQIGIDRSISARYHVDLGPSFWTGFRSSIRPTRSINPAQPARPWLRFVVRVFSFGLAAAR